LSIKRATGNIVIHKLLAISILRKQISALSRLKYGFDPRTRCQIFPGLQGRFLAPTGPEVGAAGENIFIALQSSQDLSACCPNTSR
jgi:hypothetical protein